MALCLSPGSFPLIGGNWPAQNCNARQQKGRKQKSVLSASAAKFGCCVLLFQLLGMKWLSERVTNPGLAGLCAAWRRCLKWHFNPEGCADMSHQHKRRVVSEKKKTFCCHCVTPPFSILFSRTNRQHSLACRETFFKVLLVIKKECMRVASCSCFHVRLFCLEQILEFDSPNSFFCNFVSKSSEFHKKIS